jgi:tripartite-type tricarboxylate transporter receptor subunit TctC
MIKQVPYDPLTDFAPIARTVNLPSLVVVSDKLPVKTIQDFIVYAKANPRKLQYGYGNVSGQIAGEMLKRKTGIDMTAVPYRGNPQGLTDLIAGNIAIMIVDSGTGLASLIGHLLEEQQHPIGFILADAGASVVRYEGRSPPGFVAD